MVEPKFSMFFDRAGVIKRVKDGTRSTLSRFGAFVWRRAKSSIRRRKRVAAAGSPPSSHVGTLRDLIFFGYDTRTDSVVVGPQLFGRRRGRSVPNVLEHGGASVDGRGKSAVYRKFPFMQPALDAERDNFAGLFSGAIKG